MEQREIDDISPSKIVVSPRPKTSGFTKKNLELPDIQIQKIEMAHESNFLEKMAFKAKKSIEFSKQPTKKKKSVTTENPIKIIEFYVQSDTTSPTPE